MKKKEIQAIGWREEITIPEFSHHKIKVKVDTGARTSALHVTGLKMIKKGRYEYASFKIHPNQDSSHPSVSCEKRVLEKRNIKSSNGQVGLDQQMSDYSKRNILKMIRRIFEMAVEDSILAVNPTKGLKVKVFMKEQKVLTASEADIFLSSAKLTQHRFYPVWVVALLTGMRSGEMYALKWSDIDFESNTLSVNKQWTSKNGFGPTKTRESRIVPISPELSNFLKEFKLARSFDSSSEFVLPHLQEWTHGEQSKITREFCRSLGITEIKFHDLRATFITNMLAQGAPLVTVMAIVGHKRMSTTDVYLRLAGLNLKGATDQLGYKIPKDADAQILSFKSAKNLL